MALVKCPRCELNYMNDTDRYCAVCRREMRGEEEKEEVVLCSACSERPALPGEDLCAVCLKEINRQERILQDNVDDQLPTPDPSLDLNVTTSSMDEIDIDDLEDEIPANEYVEIDRELRGSSDDDEEEDDEDVDNGFMHEEILSDDE